MSEKTSQACWRNLYESSVKHRAKLQQERDNLNQVIDRREMAIARLMKKQQKEVTMTSVGTLAGGVGVFLIAMSALYYISGACKYSC
jgi:hypothetical protein